MIYVQNLEPPNVPAPKKQKTLLPRMLDGKFFEVLTGDWSSSQPKIIAKCQTCGKTRKGDIRSTGNFMEHYRSCHPSLVQAVEKYKKYGPITEDSTVRQLTIPSAFSPLTTHVVGLDFIRFVFKRDFNTIRLI